MIAPSSIAAIEAQAAVAWPAIRSVVVGDWLVRLSDGYTRRANATSAIRSGATLDAALPAIEARYAAHGQPAQFRLTPLAAAGCDEVLASAGYVACDASIVMTTGPGDAAPAVDVRIDPFPHPAWLVMAASIAGHDDRRRAAHAALLARIETTAGFATVFDRGEAVGVGLGVVEDDRVGLFDLAVAPMHRGSGNGRRLVAGLRQWGLSKGARTAWLQVAETNARAIALYAAAGFTAAYRYHYRVAPGAPPAG